MAKPARYRKPVIVGSVFHRLRRRELDRKAHSLVIELHGRWGGIPQRHADWHSNLRRNQASIYGSLLRFLDVAVEHGTDEATLQQIPQWIAYYISDSIIERDRLRRGMRHLRTSAL